jgi:hypothetical protein
MQALCFVNSRYVPRESVSDAFVAQRLFLASSRVSVARNESLVNNPR